MIHPKISFLIPLLFTACIGDDASMGSDTHTSLSTPNIETTTTTSTTTEAASASWVPPTSESGSESTTSSGTSSDSGTSSSSWSDPDPICGNGVQEVGEACDDGNDVDTDACLSSCILPSCGDGIVQEGVEECDNGPECREGDEGCMMLEPCSADCQKDRIIFVSGKSYTGRMLEQGEAMPPVDLSGVELADYRCQLHADAAGLPGTFMAWISTSKTNPTNRLGLAKFKGSFRTVLGDVIAVGWADLIDAKLTHAIDTTEEGDFAAKSTWTGTTPAGWAASNHCNDWTQNDGDHGTIGLSQETNAEWTLLGEHYCAYAAALYCVQVEVFKK